MKRRKSIWSATGPFGRFRMLGLMVRRQAAKRGLVVIGGKKITVPGAKKRKRKA